MAQLFSFLTSGKNKSDDIQTSSSWNDQVLLVVEAMCNVYVIHSYTP